ncbi:MAG: DUF885 domain-containing protein, partial [Planctomycetes bacterium]|nr:DUF885 domain-containing protein [Planctomycetota bacterium]
MDHRAASGVADPALRRLIEDHWEETLRRSPTFASRLGDRRYDRELPGTAPADHEAARAKSRDFLDRARAIALDGLGGEDRLTLGLYREEMESHLTVSEFRIEEWQVIARSNPATFLGWLPEVRPLSSPADAEALLARYRAFPAFVDGTIETLRRGATGGRVAGAEALRRTVALVRSMLGRADGEQPAVDLVPVGAAREEARAVFGDVLRPALARYADFLEGELLPHGRTGDREGLGGLPEGEACYAALIRANTTLPLTAAEIHATGRTELDRIHSEFRSLGAKALGTGEIPEIFRRLREDPALRFSTAGEVEAKARSALAAAQAAVPSWFGRLPRAPCIVKRVPEHEAPFTTVAYYRPPGGAEPGEYRVNVHEPSTRPRHEAEALAFHEAVPGHHLQVALARELPDLPAFRRHGGITAYVEGWALYAERLADEMGLYSGDTDRLGMLAFDGWRAARLVVDTGLHAFGWTRERAIAFMRENTPLAENNIDNEVDRYVSWPGQALSYKIGQLTMWRLRREAEAAHGAAFDIRAFHDLVLG